MPLFTRTRTNPIFYADRLELLLRDEPDRLERMRTEPANPDLMAWNVFASLDTHDDPDWLAYRLQLVGGPNLRAPARISLFSGRTRAPHLRPSPAYLAEVRRRAGVGDDERADLAIFSESVEVPVRIETPEVLVLVDAGRQRLRSGVGGRDRIAEIVDAGLDHARRLSSRLSVGLILDDDSYELGEISSLQTADGMAERVPWRADMPRVDVHGTGWLQVLDMWDDESRALDLGGQPVRAFEQYAHRAAG